MTGLASPGRVASPSTVHHLLACWCPYARSNSGVWTSLFIFSLRPVLEDELLALHPPSFLFLFSSCVSRSVTLSLANTFHITEVRTQDPSAPPPYLSEHVQSRANSSQPGSFLFFPVPDHVAVTHPLFLDTRFNMKNVAGVLLLLAASAQYVACLPAHDNQFAQLEIRSPKKGAAKEGDAGE